MEERELIDGERGILTEKDREFLAGEVDLSEYEHPQKQKNVFHHRIRKRVKRGIKDFILIERYLSKEDWDKILEDSKEFEEGLKDEASRTGQMPAPEEQEYPDVLAGLHSAINCILNPLAEIHGRQFALRFVEYNLRDIIQTQTALSDGQFFYGEMEFQMDSIEEKVIDIDEAYESLVEIVERKEGASSHERIARQLNESLDELIHKLPEMQNTDYIALIDVFWLTGRITSERDYKIIREMMERMVWDVKESSINEAIDEWHYLPGIE